MGRHHPTLRIGLIVVVAGLAGAQAAGASIGAGIGASPIQMAHVARPGHSYRLGDAYVVNTGSQAARYRIEVERLSTGSGRAVPSRWVIPGRNDFRLAAHRSAIVPLTLRLPANAPTGGYLSDVVVTASPPGPVHGTAIGAAAATKLMFRVGNAPFRLPGWIEYALIALLAALVGRFVARRSRFQIRLEHIGRT
jgi:hypothetical protein